MAQEMVQISKSEYQFLMQLTMDMATLTEAVGDIGTVLTPFISMVAEEGEGKAPKPARMLQLLTANFKEIKALGPQLGPKIEIINRIYPKYSKLSNNIIGDGDQKNSD